MAIVRNEDIKIMTDVEELLHKKLEETNTPKEEDNEEWELWTKYWNIVERFINDKKRGNEKSAKYNKDNAQYHRLSNNLYWARKRKDKERIEYYTQKLKEYKERKNES